MWVKEQPFMMQPCAQRYDAKSYPANLNACYYGKTKSFFPNDVREEKIKLLNQIKPVPIDDFEKYVFRAQYTSGRYRMKEVKGYLEELGQDSNVETYAAVKFTIIIVGDVPIYLRTAKRLHENATYISVKLKPIRTPNGEINDNWIIISIQPKESIHIEINTKVPGLDDKKLEKFSLMEE